MVVRVEVGITGASSVRGVVLWDQEITSKTLYNARHNINVNDNVAYGDMLLAA